MLVVVTERPDTNDSQALAPSLSEITLTIPPSIRSDKNVRQLAFYEDLVGHLRDQPLNVLEVGVFHGGSTLLLAGYFPTSRILAVDIQEPPLVFYDELRERELTDRVKVVMVSQADAAGLQGTIESFFGSQQLDLIIDDASHLYSQTRATFDIVFGQYVKPGGIYVIEDWGCGYWPLWDDGHPDGRHGLPKLIKELIDLVALPNRTMSFDGPQSLLGSPGQPSPISRAMITNGISAFVRSEAPMPEPTIASKVPAWFNRRVARREITRFARTVRKRLSERLRQAREQLTEVPEAHVVCTLAAHVRYRRRVRSL